jgi:UDP-glucose 4-epimerase
VPAPRVVLVTGVSRWLGGRLASLLAADPSIEKVIGVDVVPPRGDADRALAGVEFVRADIRNPIIAKVIASADVDTVVHLNVIATPLGAGGRSAMKEINVIGTMQLLAACQQASTVRRLGVKSSTAVYGSSARDPALFTEGMAPKRMPRHGYGKDSVEVENYVRGFARRRPDVAVTMLRCANLIGPTIDTSLTQYFSMPVVPTVLGFDARLQFLHEQDALDAVELATVSDTSGTFNVAGDGIVTLSQAIRRVGHPEAPLPAFAMGAIGSLFRQAKYADLSPEQVAFLTYGRGVDTTRMRTLLGFEPRFTSAEAFGQFASRVRPGVVNTRRWAERVGV